MLRIIFMGTPEFAVPSLNILHENGYNIVGVITATDKLGGRGGKKLLESDVKKEAKKLGLNILQPKNLKSANFIEELRSLNADLQIVVAFRMLPEVVWNMPRLGTYNLHGSLLPKYRGAAPIHWAVMNGETETGVTSFKLKHKIDTGDLLLQEKIKINQDQTTGEVYAKLKSLGAKVVLQSVVKIESGKTELSPQDATLACAAPKLTRNNTKINFNNSSKDVYNFIRGLNPFPLAWTELDFKETKIIKAKISSNRYPKYYPGTIVSDNKTFLEYCTQDGSISVSELKVQGKKQMDIKSFLNGYRLAISAQ